MRNRADKRKIQAHANHQLQLVLIEDAEERENLEYEHRRSVYDELDKRRTVNTHVDE